MITKKLFDGKQVKVLQNILFTRHYSKQYYALAESKWDCLLSRIGEKLLFILIFNWKLLIKMSLGLKLKIERTNQVSI